MKKTLLTILLTLIISGCSSSNKQESSNHQQLQNNKTEKKYHQQTICSLDEAETKYQFKIFHIDDKVGEYKIEVKTTTKLDRQTRKMTNDSYQRMAKDSQKVKGYNFSYKIKGETIYQYFYYNFDQLDFNEAKSLGLTKDKHKMNYDELVEKIKTENRNIKCNQK